VFPELITTANGFRLPDLREWEFAARGGVASRGHLYSGSDNVDEVAWHISNSGPSAHVVATKKPNELGIFDMSGNMWEWCFDGANSFVRGGDWYRWATGCAISEGGIAPPTTANFSLGFRVALNFAPEGQTVNRFSGTLKDGLTAYYSFDHDLSNAVAPEENAILLGSTLSSQGWVEVNGSSVEYPDPLKVETGTFSASINVYETNLTDTAGGAYLQAGEGANTTGLISHNWVNRGEDWEGSGYGKANGGDGSGTRFRQDLNTIRDKWVNYVVVSGNGTYRLFRNGVELQGVLYQNNREVIGNAVQQVYKVSGKWNSGREWWMTGGGDMVHTERIVGRFDDFTVFNRAISDVEVAQLYQTLKKQ
jgi:hypothetical protein